MIGKERLVKEYKKAKDILMGDVQDSCLNMTGKQNQEFDRYSFFYNKNRLIKRYKTIKLKQQKYQLKEHFDLCWSNKKQDNIERRNEENAVKQLEFRNTQHEFFKTRSTAILEPDYIRSTRKIARKLNFEQTEAQQRYLEETVDKNIKPQQKKDIKKNFYAVHHMMEDLEPYHFDTAPLKEIKSNLIELEIKEENILLQIVGDDRRQKEIPRKENFAKKCLKKKLKEVDENKRPEGQMDTAEALERISKALRGMNPSLMKEGFKAGKTKVNVSEGKDQKQVTVSGGKDQKQVNVSGGKDQKQVNELVNNFMKRSDYAYDEILHNLE